MHPLTYLVIANAVIVTLNTILVIHRIRASRSRPIGPTEGKWLETTVTDTDGQWRTFRLGPGDAIGFAGIRIDAIAADRIRLSHYTETE